MYSAPMTRAIFYDIKWTTYPTAYCLAITPYG